MENVLAYGWADLAQYNVRIQPTVKASLQYNVAQYNAIYGTTQLGEHIIIQLN